MPGPSQQRWGGARLPARSARVEDARAIAEFQTDCWRATYTGLVPQSYLDRVGAAEREVRWRERLLTGSRVVALAEDRGHVAGVVSWTMTELADAPALELTSLYVGPAHQGAGLGGQLLRHAVRQDPAHLWVFRDNVRARGFYEQHGFTAEGRQARDADTGLPELLYVRRWTSPYSSSNRGSGHDDPPPAPRRRSARLMAVPVVHAAVLDSAPPA